MKKVIRLTESDLTRIVKRVINEQGIYRGKFRDQEDWIDHEDRHERIQDFDQDLASVGFYDDDLNWGEYEDPTEIENFDDLPDDLPRTWGFGDKKEKHSKHVFDTYKKLHGPFQLSRKKQ